MYKKVALIQFNKSNKNYQFNSKTNNDIEDYLIWLFLKRERDRDYSLHPFFISDQKENRSR
jgi:hypothetical protein